MRFDPWNLLLPRPEAGQEFRRPIVRRLENDFPAYPSNDKFILTLKPTRLRQTHSLTPAILKDFRALSHDRSIDACIDLSTGHALRGERDRGNPWAQVFNGEIAFDFDSPIRYLSGQR
jgi:hypothetical protein